jgi:hypothetical protein
LSRRTTTRHGRHESECAERYQCLFHTSIHDAGGAQVTAIRLLLPA